MRMPIRTFPILLLVACTQTADPQPAPETTARVQPRLSCEYVRQACDPSDPGANPACILRCGVSAHCKEYTWQELQFCEHHHDYFIDYTHYCDVWGNPMWDTWCVVDFVSEPPPGAVR